jgi:hypothetical protein
MAAYSRTKISRSGVVTPCCRSAQIAQPFGMPLTGIYDASFVLTSERSYCSVILATRRKLSICCRTGVMVAEGRPHTFVQETDAVAARVPAPMGNKSSDR